MMVVAGGAVMQPLVGVVLNHFWNGQMIDSVPVYSLHSYRVGMLTIPVCYCIAILLSVFAIRETHCQHEGKR